MDQKTFGKASQMNPHLLTIPNRITIWPLQSMILAFWPWIQDNYKR